jgi:signal peptidase I
MRLILRWFLSRTVRHAVDLCRQVRKLAQAQRDQLPAATIQGLRAAADKLRVLAGSGAGKKMIEDGMGELEKVANRLLKPYPHPRWRENVEVLLVTGAIVLAIRTFFFQPMAIPSGSAQPTLFGITQEPRAEEIQERRFRAAINPTAQAPAINPIVIPGAWRRFIDKWWSGISYFRIVAKEDGELIQASEPRMVFPFVKMQNFHVGRQQYRIYASSSFENVLKRGLGMADQRMPIPEGLHFRAGEEIINLKIVSGDHLFVNRVICNFRPPRRGDIVVFTSTGIPGIIPDTHYIKRLVAIGGDRVRIGNDRHLVINDDRRDASSPGFENVYSFKPTDPPRDSHYSGHVNNATGAKFGKPGIAPLFPDENTEFRVRPDHGLAFGDNTMNSHDGRAWGDFPQDKIIGRASFVFWPITDRFGWGYR